MSSSDLDASFIIVDGHAQSSPSSPTILPKPPRPMKPTPHPSFTNASYNVGTHSSSSYAHDWSSNGTGGKLGIHGRHFVDGYGRVCNLRGVNVSGACKSPVNDNNHTFPSNPESATFVGRPFPLEEADEHFARLRRWGFSFIRFLVTWEAIEHAGPGVYDMTYIHYLQALLSKLPQYGMVAFIVMHQDVWSRYSGGSGAPAWTLEAVGLDLHALEKSGAAWLKGVRGGGHVEEERGLWPCGYQKLAASTMSTCFWAGDTFCPKLKVKDTDGQEVSIQQYLQNAFLGSWEVLVRALGNLDGVVGFEIMNEPHRGYVELPSLHEFDYNTDLHLSFVPSALQSFLLGAGHPTHVHNWVRSFPMPTRRSSTSLLNPEGHVAWRQDGPTGGRCLWEMHGVWGWDRAKKEGIALRESYFSKHPDSGEKVDWYTDFYYPFMKTWAERMRAVSSPEKMFFVEAIPNEFCPRSLGKPENQVPNMVYSPHWYDLDALFKKAFGDFTCNVQGLSRGMFPLKAFYWGQASARDNYALQIGNLAAKSYESLGEVPVVIGECGIPMDMNKKEAFKTGDFKWQTRMMDALLTALERASVGFTLWNYNPHNTDETGDDWNGENFSWFGSRHKTSSPASSTTSSLDLSQTSASLDDGARIIRAVVRPYAAKTAGIPLEFSYDINTGSFTYTWANPIPAGSSSQPLTTPTSSNVNSVPLDRHVEITSFETEIYVPSMLTHGRGLIVEGLHSPDDSWTYDEKRQTLFVVTRDRSPGKKHYIRVSLDRALEPCFEVNTLAGDLMTRWWWVWVVVLAVGWQVFGRV